MAISFFAAISPFAAAIAAMPSFAPAPLPAAFDCRFRRHFSRFSFSPRHFHISISCLPVD
jgi:hypothetical protein